MMQRIFLGLLVFACGLAFGQPAQSPVVFEAADVQLRPLDPTMSARAESYINGGLIPGGRYELHRASMADLIRTAYGLQEYEVFGGPNWLDTARYELIAKALPGSKPDDVKLMLQALLADRFKLVVHKAEESIEVNALTLGKGGLLKESEGAGEADCRGVPGSGPSGYITVNCQHMTMAAFARLASGTGSLPAVDSTGLKGTYDFTLKLPQTGMAFAEAVEKQLGLKMVQKKHPMPVLVVDSVNRAPTPNVPGVEKMLGVATEFEAASVKPTNPGNPNRKFEITRGRVTAKNIPLRTLIAISQNLFPVVGVRQGSVGYGLERQVIVGGPRWLDTDGFDIVAKTDDASPFSPEWLSDQMMAMLRALLAERFKVATHREQRVTPVLALVAGRGGPRLTPADPKSRSGCKWSPGEVSSGSAAVPVGVYTCRNVTMTQLAETLPSMNRDDVDRAVVDMTGLKGGYDFTVQWATRAVLNSHRTQTQAADGAVPEASDTPSGVTVSEALGKLGLRLEGQKAPQSVVVIDRVEPLTPDN